MEDRKKGHSMNISYVVGADALPFEQKVMAASIAQRDEAGAARQHDSDLMCHQLKIANFEMRGEMMSPSYETAMRVMDRFDQKVEQVSTEMRQLQAAFKKRKRNPVVRTLIDLGSTAHSPPTSISSKVSMSM